MQHAQESICCIARWRLAEDGDDYSVWLGCYVVAEGSGVGQLGDFVADAGGAAQFGH